MKLGLALLNRLASLRLRIWLLVIVFFLGLSVVFVLVLMRAYWDYSDELRQRQGMQFTQRIALEYPQLARFQLDQRDALETSFEQLLFYEPASALYLLDAKGVVLAGFSKQRAISSLPRVKLEPVQQLLKGQNRGLVLGDDPDVPAWQCIVAVAPLEEGAGFLYLVMRMSDGERSAGLIRSYSMRAALVLGATTLLLGALMVWALLAFVTRPLKRLGEAASRVQDGGLEAPELLERRDELGQSARAMDSMARRLNEKVIEVRSMDSARREWVASIAHDLRTPLTSLTGHLETVQLRAERLSDAERGTLLSTALRNARHLDKLSAGLLDIARLDSPDFKAQREDANLGELLDDVAARYVSTAAEHAITLEVQYPSGMRFVSLDLGLIDRAVSNLLDNAFRYTPDSGKIILSARLEGEALCIEVQDSGPGLKDEELARVFERFYQSEPNRQGKGHVGLGLSIVQRVAELHGGTVRAAHREGGGAKFTMQLKA
jgi:two-component system, OmpR family, sensor kinase